MIGWTAWCILRRRNSYVYKAIGSIVGIQLLLCLELGDFPPLWWTFDAHALWHGGSWPLAFLWYRYDKIFTTFIIINNIIIFYIDASFTNKFSLLKKKQMRGYFLSIHMTKVSFV